MTADQEQRLMAVYADWLEKGWVEVTVVGGKAHYHMTELGREETDKLGYGKK